ncbi:MAG: hypothetical protein CM1200mP2_04720 [Planctomycetaceae bacterium]|nr:MAG: hypothetical protein CM1200mP2_04720 [Planctomycetaceae bacterium]
MRPIRGQTMGIFGLGRIGRSMAVRCASLGMTVIATEKYPDEAFCSEQGIELVDFDTLLSRSDAISIHCPLNDETRGLFNADVLSKMKPDSVLINTARGGMIVESDLLNALQKGRWPRPVWTFSSRSRPPPTIPCSLSTTSSSALTWPEPTRPDPRAWPTRPLTVSLRCTKEAGRARQWSIPTSRHPGPG